MGSKTKNQFPYLIINKKQNYYARCYINNGRETEIKLSLTQNGLTKEKLQEIYEECKNDIELFCTKREYVTYTNNNYYKYEKKRRKKKK